MASELLQEILDAESRAEACVKDAEKQAREILQSMLIVCEENEKHAAKQRREQRLSFLNQKQEDVLSSLQSEAPSRQSRHDALLERAGERLPRAVSRIIDEVQNGHC